MRIRDVEGEHAAEDDELRQALRPPIAAIRRELELVERHLHPVAYDALGAVLEHLDDVDGVLRDPPRSNALAGVSAVLVGDDIHQLRALAQVLRGVGMIVTTASSTGELLIRAATARPEVILVDVEPAAPEVVWLSRTLSAIDPGLPVIAIRGSEAEQAFLTRAFDVTSMDWFGEPFEISELVRMIEYKLLTPRRP